MHKMPERKDTDRGVIYVATGAAYRELAVASARSLRRHNPGLPIDLFTDEVGFSGSDSFDEIHLVPNNHARAKIECMPLSRFQRTLFLDADTLVIAPFADLFSLLDRFEIAMAHDVRRSSEMIQEGVGIPTPYAFPQLNSGVVLYRKTPVTEQFFGDWATAYRRSGLKRDQPVLKDLLWSSDIRFYVLPPEFNLRRVTMLDAWEPLDARPTIIHSHRLLDHLRERSKARCRDLETLMWLERDALETEWARIGVTMDDKRDLQLLLSGLSEGAVPELSKPPVRSFARYLRSCFAFLGRLRIALQLAGPRVMRRP